MTIEERIEQVSNRDIAEALASFDKEEDSATLICSHIIEAYGADWKTTTVKEDCEIINDFIGRFVWLFSMHQLHEISEIQQREKMEKMQQVLGIACDIGIFFTSLGETVEIPSERLISFAEKIVERVRNA